jgi:hypothetical protein
MMGAGGNLVSTIIGFGMSATFIVFVCARIICGRFRERHVIRSRTIYEIESRPDIERVNFNFDLFFLIHSYYELTFDSLP